MPEFRRTLRARDEKLRDGFTFSVDPGSRASFNLRLKRNQRRTTRVTKKKTVLSPFCSAASRRNWIFRGFSPPRPRLCRREARGPLVRSRSFEKILSTRALFRRISSFRWPSFPPSRVAFSSVSARARPEQFRGTARARVDARRERTFATREGGALSTWITFVRRTRPRSDARLRWTALSCRFFMVTDGRVTRRLVNTPRCGTRRFLGETRYSPATLTPTTMRTGKTRSERHYLRVRTTITYDINCSPTSVSTARARGDSLLGATKFDALIVARNVSGRVTHFPFSFFSTATRHASRAFSKLLGAKLRESKVRRAAKSTADDFE